MKSKGVTTQMKALDEYFLMLLLNTVQLFTIFVSFEQRNRAVKWLIPQHYNATICD